MQQNAIKMVMISCDLVPLPLECDEQWTKLLVRIRHIHGESKIQAMTLALQHLNYYYSTTYLKCKMPLSNFQSRGTGEQGLSTFTPISSVFFCKIGELRIVFMREYAREAEFETVVY